MKTLLNFGLPIFLTIISFATVLEGSQELILENSSGESIVMEIEPGRSFIEVVESINEHFAAIESSDMLVAKSLNAPLSQHLRMDFLLTNEGAVLVKAVKKNSKAPRNFSASVTNQEKEDIAYIVRTLANNSLIKIKGAESSLKSVGDRIDHIHPFKFLAAIFTDEELKVCMRNLQGRSWVWKSFLEGLTETLAEENAAKNIQQYIPEFARHINLDINLIQPTLQSGSWNKFVDILIEKVPRLGNTGRYDM